MHVVVLGASLAGLFAAAAAQGAGATVTLVERDALDGDGPRAGVPQGTQPHVFLHRGLLAAQDLLPGLRQDLVARGGVVVDTGRLPWLSEHGWARPGDGGFDVVSLTRPALEAVVRGRVLALPGVAVVTGRAVGLDRPGTWSVRLAGGGSVDGDVVVDASGRTSRLPDWLTALGLPPVRTETVDARLGYATRRYRGSVATGVVLALHPGTNRGGLALPVEDGAWLVCASGVGEHRPPRDVAGFEAFLSTLPDPALADVAAALVPDGDVHVHRQTANVRRRYERLRGWPDGLLAVGDAVCAFDPVYGQGVTVAACEAVLLRDHLRRGRPVGRALQRRVARLADLPWAIATGEDLRFPTSEGRQRPDQVLLGRWARALWHLAGSGDARATRVLQRVYHLVGSPAELFHPALVAGVVAGRARGLRPAPRPDVLRAVGGGAAGTMGR